MQLPMALVFQVVNYNTVTQTVNTWLSLVAIINVEVQSG